MTLNEGVLATSMEEIIRSFAMQRSGRKVIKQPVGHIPLSFAPEDKHRMTDDFMVRLAKEYTQEIGIRNIQYIIFRHHNSDNEHLHIVYNRIIYLENMNRQNGNGQFSRTRSIKNRGAIRGCLSLQYPKSGKSHPKTRGRIGEEVWQWLLIERLSASLWEDKNED